MKAAPTNPLGLAVLAWLMREPMHPYALGQRLQQTGQDRRIKYNRGTLYSVIEQLARAGLVEVQTVERPGARPERAIYAITDAGRAEFRRWLAELLATPRSEFPQFLVALSFVALVPPVEAVELLARRLAQLESSAEVTASTLQGAREAGHPWVFLVEEELAAELLAAEIRFVTGLIERLGDPVYVDAWQQAVGGWL